MLFVIYAEWKKENKSGDTKAENVNGSVDIPSEPFAEAFKNDNGRICRADIEIVH